MFAAMDSLCRRKAVQLNLSTKLIMSNALTLLGVAVLFLAAVTAVLQWGPQMMLRNELANNAHEVAAGMSFDSSGKLIGMKFKPRIEALYDAWKSDAIYRVLDKQGNVLFASDHVLFPFFAGNAHFFNPALSRFEQTNAGIKLRVLTMAVDHGADKFYVQVARSKRFSDALLGLDSRHAELSMVAAVLISTLVFTAVVAMTFRRLLKPLRDASAAAAKIEPNNLAARLSSEHMPSELVPLIEAFNKALERVEHGYRVQQEFLATAAHELKTPLALMRGQIELDNLADPGQLLRDIDHMARQVQQLLNLAEISDPQNFIFKPVDVMSVAANASDHLQRLAQRFQVDIKLRLSGWPLTIQADEGALFVLLKNLLENAIHHSAPGQEVQVVAGTGLISIQDQGDGIAPEDMPMLFKRFWRGAKRRDDGAGLGLAICAEIARVHGWTINVCNKHPGAEFTIDFRGVPPRGSVHPAPATMSSSHQRLDLYAT
jgi:two-component system sensor histidine kinase QseC